MLSINTGTIGHVAARSGDGSSAGPVPAEDLNTLNQALQINQLRIVGHYQSDAVFKALRGKRSFREMFTRVNWVNYDPSNQSGNSGWTIPASYPHDIVITQFALRMGHGSAAGTIVHKLAHLNGADGTSDAAERTLKCSGLESPSGPYNSAIRG
jgi:hypothetical protein